MEDGGEIEGVTVVSDSFAVSGAENEVLEEDLEDLDRYDESINHSGPLDRILGTSLTVWIFWRKFIALISRTNILKRKS